MGFLRTTLVIAAVTDWLLAALILVPVTAVTDALNVPIGAPVMHFRFAGLLLAVLPIFYLMGAASARLAPPIAAGAVLARAAGVVFLLAHLLGGEAATAYWFFCGLDGAFAVLHGLGLRRAGRTLLGALAGGP
jgi:hypothetical protein